MKIINLLSIVLLISCQHYASDKLHITKNNLLLNGKTLSRQIEYSGYFTWDDNLTCFEFCEQVAIPLRSSIQCKNNKYLTNYSLQLCELGASYKEKPTFDIFVFKEHYLHNGNRIKELKSIQDLQDFSKQNNVKINIKILRNLGTVTFEDSLFSRVKEIIDFFPETTIFQIHYSDDNKIKFEEPPPPIENSAQPNQQ